MIALALALTLGAAPGHASGALATVTSLAAQQALEDVPVGRRVGISVQAKTRDLAQAAQSRLIDALVLHGAKAALPLTARAPADAAIQARAQGLDVLLWVHVGLEGPDLILAGERIDTWVNFWDGKTPIRQLASKTLAARAPADAEVLTLSPVAAAPPPAAPRFALTPIAHLSGRAVALALIDAEGDEHLDLAVLTPIDVEIVRQDGEVLFHREHRMLPEAARPSRDPTGGLVATDGPPGRRLSYFFSGRARGEALSLDEDGLHPVGLLDATPLCSGNAGTIDAMIIPGTNLFGPEVRVGLETRRLPQPVLGMWANPVKGEPAFLAAFPNGQVQPLTADLASAGSPIEAAGTSVLADLDGDGIPEIVASSAASGPSDVVRVLEPDSAAPRFKSEPISGAILAATAGDLDGDGKADAVLAAIQPDGSTVLYRLGVAP